jgi:RimJ/RimL family protein N-acetyltransferase
MEQVKLKLYSPSDFEVLAKWITGPEMLFQFSGTTFSYPITEAQIASYQSENPDRRFYLGYQEGKPVFFGEIIPQNGQGPRLGRLLVGEPANRGKGIGMLFTRLLIGECRRIFNAATVELYVWENNEAAINCYKKVGFAFVLEEPFKMVHDGVEYKLLKMRIDSKDDRLR